MELNFSGMAFLVGALVGVICMGGLSLGFKILIQAQNDLGMTDGSRRLRYFFAVLVLVFQLGLAMLLLFKTPWVRISPLGVGSGMIVSILASALIMNKFSGKSF
jgi:hypothetical protein